MRVVVAVLSALALSVAAFADGVVPRPSPEYAVKLTDGRQILLSSYRGQVVALMFISTTCPHCQKTCELMERLQREYGPRGFRPIAVAFNDMARMLVPEFVKQHRLTFPVGYDDRDPVFTYLERSPMLRTFVPMLVFVDRKGTIRSQHLGDDKIYADLDKNIRAMVEQLISEPAGRRAARALPRNGVQ